MGHITQQTKETLTDLTLHYLTNLVRIEYALRYGYCSKVY